MALQQHGPFKWPYPRKNIFCHNKWRGLCGLGGHSECSLVYKNDISMMRPTCGGLCLSGCCLLGLSGSVVVSLELLWNTDESSQLPARRLSSGSQFTGKLHFPLQVHCCLATPPNAAAEPSRSALDRTGWALGESQLLLCFFQPLLLLIITTWFFFFCS